MDIRERIVRAAAEQAREKRDKNAHYEKLHRREQRMDEFLDYLLESFKPLRGLTVQKNSNAEPYEIYVSKIGHQNSVIISYGETVDPGRGLPSHYRIWLTAFYSKGNLSLRFLVEPTVKFRPVHEADCIDSNGSYLRSWWDDDEMVMRDKAKELIVDFLTSRVHETEYKVNA